jgi:hypothetical protein
VFVNSSFKKHNLLKRVLIDIAGFGLMILAPFLGWLPGPGGIPLFLAGLGLVSINHAWARKLLKDFDVRRVAFTDRYLMAGWLFSITLDLVCLILLGIGIYVAFTADQLYARAIALGICSLALVVILSNQKRLDRIFAKFKKQ